MAVKRKKSRRFVGVYYFESEVRPRVHGKKDKCYEVLFKEGGKTRRQKIGWSSEGVTEAYAHTQRNQILDRMRGGESVRGNRLTFGEAFDEWRTWALAEGLYVSQEEHRYNKHLKLIFEHVRVGNIRARDLDELKSQLAKEYAPATVQQIFGLMRRVVNKAIKRGLWQGINPVGAMADFKMPKVENQGERFLTEEEARVLLDACAKRGHDLYVMSMLSLRTGLRSTEIFELRGSDPDKGAGIIRLRGKGGRRQVVRAPADVLALLAEYQRGPEDYLFADRNGLKLKNISRRFTAAVNDVGLNVGITEKKNKVWFHVWRHTFASWLAQAGVSLYEIKELMRHENIEQTMRYAKLIPDITNQRLDLITSRLAGAKVGRHLELQPNAASAKPQQPSPHKQLGVVRHA